VTWALEGSSFVAGAAVQWLRDGLGILPEAAALESLARSVPDAGGVSFVPALSGLGAPYWEPEARGLLCGLTRGTTRAHLARATVEGIAHSVEDLLSAMGKDVEAAGAPGLHLLRVDGGVARSELLLELQASLSAVPVVRPEQVEATALGAGLLCLRGLGLTPNGRPVREHRVEPSLSPAVRGAQREAWHRAVRRALP